MAPNKKSGGIIKQDGRNPPLATQSPTRTSVSRSPADKPLFPPGFKYPLSLLHERCQKNGWEKPTVDTRKQTNGWSFVVTLSTLNPKTSQRETVRLEPHPPYILPTALEARHWGATYALYCFCNGIQLNRVLPPGPRDYWNELASEHKMAPEHMKWKYDSNPFAARKEVDERQRKAAKTREETTQLGKYQQVSHQSANHPEVKMASELRDIVEGAVKKAILLYPEAADATPSSISEEEASKVFQQLGHHGFTPNQARSAVTALSTPSALSSNLLRSLSPLDASIEYLVLHVPECDLPQRFLPSSNSSNPFITSTHSGNENLKRRWIEDKAIKEAGWPPHIVKECTCDTRLSESWDLLITVLGKRLIGKDWNDVFDSEINTQVSSHSSEMYNIIPEEVEALGAHYADASHLVMPLFSAPVELHILVSPNQLHTHIGHPPMYITSNTIPPYVRLHLLSQLLRAMESGRFVESGEGFCVAAMRFLEGEWAHIEDNGPPDISAVLQHLVPRRPSSGHLQAGVALTENIVYRKPHGRRKAGIHRHDDRDNIQVKADFQAICLSDDYARLLSARQKLPAFSVKNTFLNLLETNSVLVVVGETGCGKTTQLPQFVLDSLILSNYGLKASIIVTQPRRISAISVAARVSAERLEDGSVGYAIRGESRQEKRTKLLFCTTGVVLRRLGTGDNLEDVTHVIVDEVHERSIDGDFLLLELKELLSKRPSLKIILMSATINHDTFIRYFNGAPLLTIPGHTHPVTDLYLEDFIPLISYQPMTRSNRKETEEERRLFLEEFTSRGLDTQNIHAIQTISRSERIDFQLVAAIVKYIVITGRKRGGVLIFLPGVQEIRQCIEIMRTVLAGIQVHILPLHANLSSEEQRRVFERTSKWKIIAATNVAETSITIDDVIYVIDAGKVKETQYDPETGLSCLVETWVTKAAARQRRGRAGRTQPGVCYKLYTKNQEENMAGFPVPEILRVPLDRISLSVKAMREEEDVKLFLSRAIDPPKTIAIEKAWSTLEELGAIDENGRLTALGRHIAMLPVDLRLAKMLVLGTIFRCLSPILTIAASLSSKPLFLSPMDKREEATAARTRFATGNSDLLTDLHAYDECARYRSEGKSQSVVRAFCEENFISISTLREITTLRHEFLSSLSDLGFVPLSSTPTDAGLNTNKGNINLLKAIILGGLWPHVGRVQLPKSAIKFDQLQSGTVQRENTAQDFKIYDLKANTRVFLHPGSILFGATAWKSPFLVYFHKHMTSKIFLRDATEIPLYALLLFGGPVTVNQVAGGLHIGREEGEVIKLRAWPRIGILVNQLRRLLDAQMQRCVEDGTMLNMEDGNEVLEAMLDLLSGDGLTVA